MSFNYTQSIQPIRFTNELGATVPQIHALAVQYILYFIIVLVLLFAWSRMFKRYKESEAKSDLTSAILFLTCAPLSVAFVGSVFYLFTSVRLLIDPSSYLLMY